MLWHRFGQPGQTNFVKWDLNITTMNFNQATYPIWSNFAWVVVGRPDRHHHALVTNQLVTCLLISYTDFPVSFSAYLDCPDFTDFTDFRNVHRNIVLFMFWVKFFLWCLSGLSWGRLRVPSYWEKFWEVKIVCDTLNIISVRQSGAVCEDLPHSLVLESVMEESRMYLN